MSNNKERRRLYFFILLLAAVVLLILGRLVQLMIFTPQGETPESITLPVVERGPILDRNGKILAISTRLDSVSAWIPNVAEPDDSAELLSQILEIPLETVLSRLENSTGFVFIKRKITPTESEAIQTAKAEGKLAGIDLSPEFGRNYPEQTLASHVLGYVGVDNIGLDGIEYTFNHVLSPPAVSTVREEKEVLGHQVFLTIDINIQQAIEGYARMAYEENQADAVSILVMEAATGDILGYCGIPNFDPNEYNRYDNRALKNLPLVQAFEPGSVFKIFSISSFLQLGGLDPEAEFFCGGVYQMVLPDGQTIEIRDLASHGWVNAEKILKYSCNVGAALASEQVGEEDFHRMLELFGFGKPTDLPLPGESAGILSEPVRWSARSKATIAFGQEVSVSSLQILQGATVFANRGLILRPHIVKKIVSAQGETIQKLEREPLQEVLSPESAQQILQMMETATEDGGTARRGRVEGVRVSAKTGTAEVLDPETGEYSEDHFVASYLGILPTDDPQLIIYVVIDHPKGPAYYGSQVAAPVFKETAEWLVDYLGIPRSGAEVIQHSGSVRIRLPEPLQVNSDMPELLGMPKRLLLPLFQQREFEIRMSGDGYVVAQDPPPGTPLKPGTVITLYLE
ncbi:MAG: transpeptidase family protein [Spirochaetaceae bacterium]|nr:MAG: transpeptidase family protein [Spirochaetaceae bacterium]